MSFEKDITEIKKSLDETKVNEMKNTEITIQARIDYEGIMDLEKLKKQISNVLAETGIEVTNVEINEDKYFSAGQEVGYHGRSGEVKGYDGSYVIVYFSDTGEEESIEEDELIQQNESKVNEYVFSDTCKVGSKVRAVKNITGNRRYNGFKRCG